MQAAERGPQHDGRREGEQHQAGQRHPYVRERGRRSHEPLGRRHEDKNPEEDPEHGEEDGIEADGGPAAALRGKRGGAAGHFDDVGLGVGHLDREGGERNVLRRLCGDVHDDLGVRHDELGRVAELGDAFGHAVLLYDEALGMSVEKLADGLHLRQDQTALGGACVDRRDENDPCSPSISFK